MAEEVFTWPVRVYYEDTDAGGVVYHSIYLNYMERARTEWLRAAHIQQESLAAETGLRFAVARMEIDFRAPARLDDALEVRTRLVKSGGASLALAQEIVRPGDGARLITAMVRVACIDDRFRPARMPPSLRHAMKLD